jgi:protoheme IX farnesyltransferase
MSPGWPRRLHSGASAVHRRVCTAAAQGRGPAPAAAGRLLALRRGVVRDLVALTKPSITASSVMMAAGGLALAPGGVAPVTAAALLAGTALAVASANALNMWSERITDGLMRRTRGRPLPAGRLRARTALGFGLALGAGGVALLALGVNLLTAALGLGALVGYVWIYTPLKRRTHLAMLIGALPGAAPPLMGWTAATGGIDAPGVALFAVLFAWQVPHFIAIGVRTGDDYAAAGIRTLAAAHGLRAAHTQAIAYAAGLIPVSATLVPLGVAGGLYLAAALALGAWLLALACAPAPVWSGRLFRGTLIYLPALVLALAADRMLG